MISDIKQIIINKIKELYPAINIYDEKVQQSLNTPSFLVIVTDFERTKRIDKIFKCKCSFDVAYFPQDEYQKYNEMYGVEEALMKELEDLSLCSVKNMKGNIKDDVLHILFDVSYSEISVTDKIMMNKNDINTNKKEAY